MKTETIRIGKFQFRYSIEGKGIPTLVMRSSKYDPAIISQNLRQHLQFIFIDHKNFGISPGEVDHSEFALDVLIDDMETARQALGLENMIVLGHSGHSYLALEYAKKYPAQVSHVVMIGCSLNLSEASTAAAEQYWQKMASPERKAAMMRNIRQLPDEQLEKLPPDQRFIQRYLRNTPRIWYDYDFMGAKKLWDGVQVNMQMMDYVWGTIFRDIDITLNLDKLEKPVFLALGRYDFLAGPPESWDSVRPQFKNLTLRIFEKSGHTPQIEEPELFDKELLEWLQNRR
jgi:pimeloyl-ACP methyl ester carboxylesterase